MGILRVEPKKKPLVSDREYREFASVLHKARTAADEHHVFYDMEAGENANLVRKAFVHIATSEGIPVTIRRVRGKRSLSFNFRNGNKGRSTRMSATESRKLIINALSGSDSALQKSQILQLTGISPSSWNVRIRELVQEGKVIRHGDRRDTRYSLSA